MLTIAVKFVLFISIVKNFHITLPAFVDKIIEIVFTETGKTNFEYQLSEGPFSIDIVLGPAATTTAAPGSKEVQPVPTGTVVAVPATETTPATVDGNSLDAPADPSNPGGPVI